MQTPFAPIDVNFWRLDTESNPQAIASYCTFDRVPDIKQFREIVSALPDSFPRLHQKVLHLDPPQWIEDSEFSVENHFSVVTLPHVGNHADLVKEAGAYFSRRFNSAHPPWEIYILLNREPELANNTECCAAMLFKIHHALADGVGGLELVNQMFRDERQRSSADSKKQPRPATCQQPAPKTNFLERLRIARGFFKLLREALIPKNKSPLNGKNSPLRNLLLAELDIEALRGVKRQVGGTLNDIMLTIVTGAVRKYHLAGNSSMRDIRAIMPVSLRSRTDKMSLGNHLSAVGVRLPISLPEPSLQLKAIRNYIGRLKFDGSVSAYALLGYINARMPRCLQRWLAETQARKGNFICTNMPSSGSKQQIAGARVEGNYGVPALMRDQGVAFSFISYGGKVCTSIVVDPKIVADPQRLLSYFNEAAQEVISLGCLRPSA